MPYATVLPSQVKTFPAGLVFGTPSSFGVRSLMRILDAAGAISFDCKCVGVLRVYVSICCICSCFHGDQISVSAYDLTS